MHDGSRVCMMEVLVADSCSCYSVSLCHAKCWWRSLSLMYVSVSVRHGVICVEHLF